MRCPGVHEVEVGVVEACHGDGAVNDDDSAVGALAVQNEDAPGTHEDVVDVSVASWEVVEDDPAVTLELLKLLAGRLLTKGSLLPLLNPRRWRALAINQNDIAAPAQSPNTNAWLGHRCHPTTDSTNTDAHIAVTTRKKFFLRLRQARVSVVYLWWALAPTSPCDMTPGSPVATRGDTRTRAIPLTSTGQ